MHRFGLILASVVLAAGPATAQTSGTGLTVGNTLTGVYEEGNIVVKLKRDGSYSMTVPDGTGLTGHWVADHEYLCMINDRTKPNSGYSTRCEKISFAGRKFGESWKFVDSYGKPVTLTITKGQ